jgi:Flp pilus assembly protein TadD
VPDPDALRKFVALSPNDPFPRYGLAMALKQAGRGDEAREAFGELEQRFPDYVPQYLMHAQLLIGEGQKGDARGVIERGIAAAQRKGDGHALGELQGALDGLGDD